MSTLKIAALSLPAFSGRAPHVNKRASACLAGVGPIPPGSYYIFDRQHGGRLEAFRNLFSDHSEWFALYAIDGKIDDETFCNQVKRGNFRLRSAAPAAVPDSDLKAYGKVTVA